MSSKNQLISWFLKNRKTLPWRPEDPYAFRNDYFVWISEIMLQQTQVAAVCEHFSRWILRFPTITDLANASEKDVLSHWQGLGYYSRAKNILMTAQILVRDYNGLLPPTRKELEDLPGIGKYTAGAILSLARHENEAILDGNLIRIFSRLEMIPFLPDQKSSSDFYWNLAREWSSSKNAFLINEALMELGRNCCKVKNPTCNTCPLKSICKAFISNQTHLYPPQKKKSFEEWVGLILVIESSNGKIYFTENSKSQFLKKQKTLPHFEFPYSKTMNYPSKAEEYISFDLVKNFQFCGRYRHSITRYKIDCNVLHILTTQKISSKNPHWVSKKEILKEAGNSFSLKALKLAGI
jgi:A/G-specific adenine glycosylase